MPTPKFQYDSKFQLIPAEEVTSPNSSRIDFVASINEMFPENLSPPSMIWKDWVKLERSVIPSTVMMRKIPESPKVTRTKEKRDHPKLTKTYPIAIQLRSEVIRSRTPSQEKKGLLNQLSVTMKSVFRILFALLISKEAIFSIIVKRNKKIRAAKGRAMPELNPKMTKQNRRTETGNEIRR
jgi:hypothetical protein